MSRITRTKDRIILHREALFFGIGIFALLMAGAGVRMLFEMLPVEEKIDIFGVLVLCFWILCVLGMGFCATTSGSKQVSISDDGICCKTLLKTELLEWSEIKDWGLSYCGQTRGEGNTYYLYFAKEVSPIKNECKKKLKGKMIKVFVFEEDYKKAVSEIIPFCSDRTSVEPFIGKDKFHFM